MRSRDDRFGFLDCERIDLGSILFGDSKCRQRKCCRPTPNRSPCRTHVRRFSGTKRTPGFCDNRAAWSGKPSRVPATSSARLCIPSRSRPPGLFGRAKSMHSRSRTPIAARIRERHGAIISGVIGSSSRAGGATNDLENRDLAQAALELLVIRHRWMSRLGTRRTEMRQRTWPEACARSRRARPACTELPLRGLR
jgi:hypothetical protein